MWRMLGFGWMGMSKAKEGSFDIPRHGFIDGALVIIPSEGKATVFGAGPIGFEHVFLGKYVHQVVDVGLVGVFDAKVIDHEGEFDGASGVLPKTWGDGAGRILASHGASRTW
jgi:hypothetical protein